MSKPNPQQQRILDASITRYCAVSAGAGTGKSATLRGKVIDLIKSEKVKPSEFLIVTFTNDAASSLKNKIKSEIRKSPELRHLTSEVDSMHIDTLDAFRLFIIKKYASVIGISSDVSVMDGAIYKLESYKHLDAILTRYLNEKNPLYEELIKTFVVKGDSSLRNFIMSISNKMEDEGRNKDEFLKEYYDKYLSDEHFENLKDLYSKDIISKIDEIVLSIRDILDNAPLKEDKKGNLQVHKNVEYFDEKISRLEGASTYKEYYDGLQYYLDYKGRLSDWPEYEEYEHLKALKTELDKFKMADLEGFDNNDKVLNQKFMPLIFEIAYELKTEMDRFMSVHNVYRFGDIAKLALKVLENKEALEEIKNTFKVVMIDEYQDNSDLDDAFFTRIANNNLLVVGDVKQSIYGFKGANPEKFNEKYNSISKVNLEETSEPPYTMNINYRSRKEILSDVNNIFENFMDNEVGGVNYLKDGHALEYSRSPKFESPGEPEDKDKGVKKLMSLSVEELKQIYEDISGEIIDEKIVKKNRFVISSALSIIDRIKKGAKVVREQDDKTFKLVPAEFKDFAILTRNNPDSENVRKIFSSLGIPVNIIADQDIKEDIFVVTLLSLIKCIRTIAFSNPAEPYENEAEFKLDLASIMRSFISDYNDSKIKSLIGDTEFDQETHKYVTNLEYRKDPLFLKLREFAYNYINDSLYNIVSNLFNEFNFLEKLPNVGNAVASLNKYSKLLEQIQGMDAIGYSIHDLIFFFENINALGLKVEIRLGTDTSDAVTIETIHKSKGLEFPIIYIECTNKFSAKTNELGGFSSFYGNKDYGYYLPKINGVNPKEAKTIFIEKVAQNAIKTKVLSEETRLFYVALTRAQECAICVYFDELEKLSDDKKDAKTYQEIVAYSNASIYYDEYSFVNDKLATKVSSFEATKVHILNLDKNYKIIEKASSHPSVELDENSNDFILAKGTRYHIYMESVDLISKDTSFITNQKERKDIDEALKHEVFSNLKNVQIFKEYNYYDDSINEMGVIDLLLIYDDHCLVVDYKLKDADEVKYASQLESYVKYVSKTFGKETKAILIPLVKE